MKAAIALGTRPEIIKMSPIIRECDRLGLNYFILHTGQHYSYTLDRVFFEELKISEAKYNLDVGSGSHAEQTGKMLIGIEKVLLKEHPDLVLVEGDTNTVLAAVLAAVKLGIPIGHVEAGLRSYDRQMPEEINRVLADHSSDYLFAPTEKSKQILLKEGIGEENIFVTGNTIVDAVLQNLEITKEVHGRTVLDDLELESGGYAVVTVHRQENVDDEKRFCGILEGLENVHEETGLELVYPIHPRAKKRLKQFSFETKNVRFTEPLNYLSFLMLASNARLVLTDSGGVQEESCILGVPCVTLRDNTERPETLEVGSNVLAGTNPQNIAEKAKIMIKNTKTWKNPFGDGKSGHKIIDILRCKFE